MSGLPQRPEDRWETVQRLSGRKIPEVMNELAELLPDGKPSFFVISPGSILIGTSHISSNYRGCGSPDSANTGGARKGNNHIARTDRRGRGRAQEE
jgi:hypothetical protein